MGLADRLCPDPVHAAEWSASNARTGRRATLVMAFVAAPALFIAGLFSSFVGGQPAPGLLACALVIGGLIAVKQPATRSKVVLNLALLAAAWVLHAIVHGALLSGPYHPLRHYHRFDPSDYNFLGIGIGMACGATFFAAALVMQALPRGLGKGARTASRAALIAVLVAGAWLLAKSVWHASGRTPPQQYLQSLSARRIVVDKDVARPLYSSRPDPAEWGRVKPAIVEALKSATVAPPGSSIERDLEEDVLGPRVTLELREDTRLGLTFVYRRFQEDALALDAQLEPVSDARARLASVVAVPKDWMVTAALGWVTALALLRLRSRAHRLLACRSRWREVEREGEPQLVVIPGAAEEAPGDTVVAASAAELQARCYESLAAQELYALSVACMALAPLAAAWRLGFAG